MAIDTATKRNSAMLDPGNGGGPWPPDGSISSAADRGTSLEFYSGVASFVQQESPCPETFTVADSHAFSGPSAFTFTAADSHAFTSGCN